MVGLRFWLSNPEADFFVLSFKCLCFLLGGKKRAPYDMMMDGYSYIDVLNYTCMKNMKY